MWQIRRSLPAVACAISLAACSSVGTSNLPQEAAAPPTVVRLIPPPEPQRITLDAWLVSGDSGVARVAPLASRAREGDPFSQWQLGVMIDTNQIAGGTLEEAVSLFRASAERDLSAAIVSLGIMHARGRGTSQDSLAWMMAAAELGNDWARQSLRDDFSDEGVNHERARKRAADILREYQEGSPAGSG